MSVYRICIGCVSKFLAWVFLIDGKAIPEIVVVELIPKSTCHLFFLGSLQTYFFLSCLAHMS